MVGQSLGSIIVGLECAWRQHPDIFVDTMGAAFMYPLIRCLYSIKIIAYVHYPTISSVCAILLSNLWHLFYLVLNGAGHVEENTRTASVL